MSMKAKRAVPVMFAGGAASTLLDGLQVYYLLTETSGNRADSVGSATLTDSGSVGNGTGPGGDLTVASQYDGTNELISTDTIHQIASADFTMAFWYYPETTNTVWILGKRGGTLSEYGLRQFSTNIYFYLWYDTTAINTTGGGDVTVQTWHAVRADFEASTAIHRVQIDNQTIASYDHSGTPNSSNGDFWLGGADGSGNIISGSRLGGFARWSRLLTDAEWDEFRTSPPVAYPF